ncbi:MAG: hypothetical protein ACKOXM_05670 [Agromyces sp.]
MTLLAADPTPAVAPRTPPRVAELQARINGMQSSAPPSRTIPTRADLALLLPGGLREGAIYQVRGSTSLAMVALAEASAAGRWSAWVGWPQLNAVALTAAGIRLDRTAIVPNPGTHWLGILAGLADAMSVLVVRPPRAARLSPGETARLAARLRERGCTVLVDGEWPGAEAELQLEAHVWHGLGDGHGVLLDRQLRVRVRDRSGRVRRGPVGVAAPLGQTLRAVPTAPLEQSAQLTAVDAVEWAVSA